MGTGKKAFFFSLIFLTAQSASAATHVCSGSIHLKYLTLPFFYFKTVRKYGPVQAMGASEKRAIKALEPLLQELEEQCGEDDRSLSTRRTWCRRSKIRCEETTPSTATDLIEEDEALE